MAQATDDKQPPPRRNWSGPVGNDATIAARTAFVRAGFADPTLVLRWNEIAGAETARLARPIKLSSTGTLTLKAEPAAALFLQHETRSLCGRINGYLGREAVTKLKFVQGPLAPLPLPPPRRAGPTEPAVTDPARRFQGPRASARPCWPWPASAPAGPWIEPASRLCQNPFRTTLGVRKVSRNQVLIGIVVAAILVLGGVWWFTMGQGDAAAPAPAPPSSPSPPTTAPSAIPRLPFRSWNTPRRCARTAPA